MSIFYTQERCETINERRGALVTFIHTLVHVSVVFTALYAVHPSEWVDVDEKYVYLNVPAAYAIVSLVINSILTFVMHLLDRKDGERSPIAFTHVLYAGIDKMSVFDEFSIFREMGTSVLFYTLIHSLVVAFAFVLVVPQRMSDFSSKDFWQLNLGYNAIMMTSVGIGRMSVGVALYGPRVLVNINPIIEIGGVDSRVEDMDHSDENPQDGSGDLDTYVPPPQMITYVV